MQSTLPPRCLMWPDMTSSGESPGEAKQASLDLPSFRAKAGGLAVIASDCVEGVLDIAERSLLFEASEEIPKLPELGIRGFSFSS